MLFKGLVYDILRGSVVYKLQSVKPLPNGLLWGQKKVAVVERLAVFGTRECKTPFFSRAQHFQKCLF